MSPIPPNSPESDVLDLFDEATVNEIPVFDVSDAQEVDRFRASGALASAHAFDNEVARAFGVLPAEVHSSLNNNASLKKRFESIIVTHLKDIRDELETRDRLSARVEQGGMGFSFDTIEAIFKALSAPRIFITPIDIKKISAVKPKVPQPPPPAAPSEPKEPVVQDAFPSAPRSAPIGSVKPSMVDIAHPPKLVNPTDEFAALDLADMRRLGVVQFAAGVIERIEKLSRDEFANRRASIAAWRRSPLHARYIAIGRETLKSGVDVQTYLAEHSDGLTYEEFEVVSRLNEKLRF